MKNLTGVFFFAIGSNVWIQRWISRIGPRERICNDLLIYLMVFCQFHAMGLNVHVYLNHFNCSKERNYLDKIDEKFIDYFDPVRCRPLLL